MSDLTKTNITWNEGVFSDNSSRLGWGISQFNDELIRTDIFNTNQDFSFVPRGATVNEITTADSVTFSTVSIPEPTTTALIAFGLLGAGFARKRRAH